MESLQYIGGLVWTWYTLQISSRVENLILLIAIANHDEQKDTGGILYLLPNGGGLSVFFLSNVPVYHFAVKPSLI